LQPPLYFRNDFLIAIKLLSADCIFQRAENMVVGRSQIRAVRWMKQDSPLKLCDGLSGMRGLVDTSQSVKISHTWFIST
jgi:hypothetical protein